MRAARGFLLIELAIVLGVIAILAQGVLRTVPAAAEIGRETRTDRLLGTARERLVDYLLVHGVLPCPRVAAGTTLASESDPPRPDHRPVGSADGAASCARRAGLLPAEVLALPGPRDPTGAVLDAWGRPLRYALSTRAIGVGRTERTSPRSGADRPDDATADGDRNGGDFMLCRQAGTPACARSARYASGLVAVILSDGAHEHDTPDERENRDGDAVFANAARRERPGHAFDDRLVWISRLEAQAALLRAGWWP